ncbi:MAG: glycosyltransferase family 39 protein [Flavobacteriales bacterium]
MRHATMIVLISALVLLITATVAVVFANTSYTTVRAYLDSVAPDGDVEHYTPAMHANAARNAGWAAWVAGLLGALVLAGRRLLARRFTEQGPAWTRFKRDVVRSLGKSPGKGSGDQRAWVFTLIGVGALLRITQMGAPVIYDEAFTYTYYATRPLSILLSDYSFPNNHILHTMLVKLSTSLFGLGLWQVRLPALLAGIAVMPVFYLFVRAMFNRYIALMALALVAASGGLIEYSALGRGYSLTWFFFVVALLAGRHFVKTNNTVSAVAVGVACALGMWSVPTMIYAVTTVYIWLLLYLGGKYESSLRQRAVKLLLSVVVFALVTALCYSPVLIAHGLPHLITHPEAGEATWASFTFTQQDKSFDLWIYIVDTSSAWIAFAGFAGLVHASFVTSKFRKLFFAMVVGCIPLVILQMNVAPPRAWNWMLFVFHLSSAIALFYLLKFIQEKIAPGFLKRTRTLVMAGTLLVLTGFLSITSLPRKNGLPRYPEAVEAAAFLKRAVQPTDLVLMQFPWEAPIEFHSLASGIDRLQLHVPGKTMPTAGQRLFLLVSPANGQTAQGVLAHYNIRPDAVVVGPKLRDWMRLEIHLAMVK